MTKVVVTGATGHVGGYVVDRLARLGCEVVAASRAGRLPAPPFGALGPAPGVRALSLDVARDAAVDVLAAELEGAALVHLAGWYPPATAASSPADRRVLLDVNVLGTQRVLEAARRCRRVEVVVYASTFEVYGPPSAPGPVTEETRPMPVNDYGVTKLAGEDYLFAFAAEQGTRAISLRLPAVYGPGEVVSRALPNFLRAVSRGTRPVVYGDGGDERDQIHAADSALAVERALFTSAAGVYNAADGARHTILDLARTAMQVAGMSGEPERRPAEKPRVDFHMSIEKARRDLGFTPEVTLAAGMEEELRWLRKISDRAGETGSS
jgi:UDP-glucose 4-epimerase